MHEVQKDRQIKTISMLNLGQGKSNCCVIKWGRSQNNPNDMRITKDGCVFTMVISSDFRIE